MTENTLDRLRELGYDGEPHETAQTIIRWLSDNEIIRIEPYWRFLGADGGFTWSKSWEEFSEKREVSCDTWEELLDIALQESLREAFPR